MVQTRGSDAIDKAQRRIALLTSIEENLDLGHGLTIEAYREKIEAARAKLEAHNRLKSAFDESCKAMREEEKELTELSDRMVSGVATKYGKNSTEYLKITISNRKRSSTSTKAPEIETPTIDTDAMPSAHGDMLAQLIQLVAQNGATGANN